MYTLDSARLEIQNLQNVGQSAKLYNQVKRLSLFYDSSDTESDFINRVICKYKNWQNKIFNVNS